MATQNLALRWALLKTLNKRATGTRAERAKSCHAPPRGIGRTQGVGGLAVVEAGVVRGGEVEEGGEAGKRLGENYASLIS